ncbi:L,D-transpeptidase [Clostridium sp. ZBS12]|uniref:L,D-transpeptidase n=1 Tax=Clostridium sp. ZBS12 TaxID=2949972 RepID=UPI00207AABE5|nr:L,D-transpeptidase [Clostridium sp. ZBS12]
MKINKNIHINKFTVYILLFTLITLTTLFNGYQYKKLVNNFKIDFDNNKFSQANNILLTQENFNPFKNLMLKRDLKKYFSNNITTLKQDLETSKLNEEEILIKANEINRYGFNSNEVIELVNSVSSLQDSINNYSNGIEHFNNNEYYEAITNFSNLSPLDLNYNESLIYLRESKSKIKDELFSKCDELCSNDYYSQALNQISNVPPVLNDDEDIKTKIAEIKSSKQQYLDKTAESKTVSDYYINNISSQNINTLNLVSNTPYLIFIDINSQKTYIYKGKSNKWDLDKTFSCSTGIDSEPTPCGAFSIKEKGEWFFSEKFKQGGKYWTQIDGDILFHSVPYAQDKTTVVDTTLNKKSSHGCIRLALSDAKWIYDNIPRDTKIIIK